MSQMKILQNTLALYVRQIIIILITLYSSRVILIELGVDDYRIYSVLTGFVTLLAFLPGGMVSATLRSCSCAMGQKDRERLKQTFSFNLVMSAAMAMVAYALLQTLGLWYVSEHLRIPGEGAAAAVELYR